MENTQSRNDSECKVYYLEEYKSLRDEIARHDSSRRYIESSFAIGLVLIYGWMFEHRNDINNTVIFYLPLLFIIVGLTREVAYRFRSNQIARYIHKFENYIWDRSPDDAPWGWETYLKKVRTEPYKRVMLVSVVLYWFLSAVLCLFLSYYLSNFAVSTH